MTETRKTIATLSGAVLAAALAFGIGDKVGELTSTDSTPPSTTTYATPDPVDCEPLVMAEGVDYSHLTAAGWTGRPTDGIEALYAPGC